MAGAPCDNCGARPTGPLHRSATGRRLCDDCTDSITGLAAGIVAAGGAGRPATPEVTARAIATEGWFRRLRRRRRSGPAGSPPPGSGR